MPTQPYIVNIRNHNFPFFMVAMIEKEPELLGVSVNQSDVKELDEEAQTATVIEVRELS